MQSESTNEISAALCKAQAAMKAAPFDKSNPHFRNRYASLASVIDTLRGPLADNGLSYTQTTELRDGGLVLVTTLRHTSGQWIAAEYPLPMVAKPQELGSAMTYARRYSLSAIACIAADEDDDGEGTREREQTNSSPAPVKQNAIKPQPPKVEGQQAGPIPLTAGEEIAWGSMFVAAINLAATNRDLDAWIAANNDALLHTQDTAPKIYNKIMQRVKERRAALEMADTMAA